MSQLILSLLILLDRHKLFSFLDSMLFFLKFIIFIVKVMTGCALIKSHVEVKCFAKAKSV